MRTCELDEAWDDNQFEVLKCGGLQTHPPTPKPPQQQPILVKFKMFVLMHCFKLNAPQSCTVEVQNDEGGYLII